MNRHRDAGTAVVVIHASALRVQSRRLPVLATACDDGVFVSEHLKGSHDERQQTVAALRALADFLDQG